MQALEAEVLEDFLPDEGLDAARRAITIAVNDDSLQTWVIPAIALMHRKYGYVLDVRVDDQDYTLNMLRDGSVLAAVTAESRPLQGCNVHRLGTMRYFAIASPAFSSTYFSEGVTAAALAAAPMIVFNRKDELQARYVRSVTRAKIMPPIHYLPTSSGVVEAAAHGIGWCLAPESLAEPALKSGRIVMIDAERWIDLPLYWQHAAIRSTTLQRVSQAIQESAAAVLRG